MPSVTSMNPLPVEPKNEVPSLQEEPPQTVNYILFMKAPNPSDDKKLKAEKVEIMAVSSEEEK